MPGTKGITIIGTGAVGSALAFALDQQGFEIASLINRNPDKAKKIADEINVTNVFADISSESVTGNIIFICVPDDEISGVVASLVKLQFRDRFVYHTSGIHDVDILRPLIGNEIGSTHPIQPFSNVNPDIFRDIWVTLNGSEKAKKRAEEIFKVLGSKTLHVDSEMKARLHLAAVMISNYLVTLSKAADEVAGLTDPKLTDVMLPLLQQTVRNITEKDFAEALSGPIKRGDTGTIQKHLELIKHDQELTILYKQLGKYTLKLVDEEAKEKLSGIFD